MIEERAVFEPRSEAEAQMLKELIDQYGQEIVNAAVEFSTILRTRNIHYIKALLELGRSDQTGGEAV